MTQPPDSRTCRWCGEAIRPQGPRPDWAAVTESFPYPVLYCPARGDAFPVHAPRLAGAAPGLTELRYQSAARFAAQIGVDPAALMAATAAVWSALNPPSVAFDQALSVAGAALRAAADTERTQGRKRAAT